MEQHIVNAIAVTIYSKEHIRDHFNNHYKTQKYGLDDIIRLCIKKLKTGVSWREMTNYMLPTAKMHWNTLFKAFQKLTKFKLLHDTYKNLLIKYFKKTPNKKLKIRLTDTTSVRNKGGIDKVHYDKHLHKKTTKPSFITDLFGIPISIIIGEGSLRLRKQKNFS